MKRVFIITLTVLLIAASAYAGTWIVTHDTITGNKLVRATQTFTGNDSSEALPVGLTDKYLYTVEIQGEDDAVTMAITSDMGATLYSTTTTAAVTGEIGTPSIYYAIPPTTTMALSNVSTGSSTTIRITGVYP